MSDNSPRNFSLMPNNSDIFADLLTDFKGSISKKDVNPPLSRPNDTNNSKKDIPFPSKSTNEGGNTHHSFDVFSSNNNNNTSYGLFDDLLMPEDSNKTNIQREPSEILNKPHIQRDVPEIEDNPFETYQSDAYEMSPNNDDNHLLHMNEHLPDKAGFFSTPFDILQKGKTFIQEQFSLNEDLLSTFPHEQKQEAITKNSRERQLGTKGHSAPVVDDLLLLDISDKPRDKAIKSSTNLLEHTTISLHQDLIPEGFTTKISNFERDSYFDFKGQGVNAFKMGNYDMALEKFKNASESIPPNHIYQVILIRNLISTCFKLGDLQAVKRYLDDVFNTLHLNTFNTWCRYSIPEKQPIMLKDIVKKILISKGDYLEAKEELQLALSVYKEILDLGLADETVVKKKQRLDQVLNPKKYIPKTPMKTKPIAKTPRAVKPKEDVDTTEIKAKVVEKIDLWQRDKPTDLRFLLSTLDTILPSWTKIDSKDLISPKKCKVHYFKAINQTHPDKVDQNASAESRILCESVFMTLNKAWDLFKAENDL